MQTSKDKGKLPNPATQPPKPPPIPRAVSRDSSALRRALLKLVFAACLLAYAAKKLSLPYWIALVLILIFFRFFEFITMICMIVFRHADSAAYGEALRRADIMAEPITVKHTVQDENSLMRYACSCMQGWRRAMEDDHSLVLLPDGGFFGVYDGHGGDTTAKFCAEHLHYFVFESEAFKSKNTKKGLHDGFVELDKHLFRADTANRTGCAAVVLYVQDDSLYCANAGDSRCVLCRGGEAFPMSSDHKPVNPGEQHRIERAGGYVWNRRVNGVLALSRAIGDFSFKANSVVSWEQQAVTSAPEVRVTNLTAEDSFAVLACDGVWDVMSNEQVIQFIKTRIERGEALGAICEALMDNCMSTLPFGIGCDNMSVIIVQFKPK